MVQDYARLPGLLRRQREALAAEDIPALETIQREIGDLSQQIVHHALSFGRLEAGEKAQLREIIERAQEEIGHNIEAWNASIAGLNGARGQLQATRRFLTSLQNQSPTTPRYSKKG